MNEIAGTIVDLSSWLAQNAVNLLIQSTALILIGLLAARLLRRKGSAVQSAIYRATLVAVLICPMVAIGLNQFGFSGWTIQLPDTIKTVRVEIEPDSQPIRSASDDLITSNATPDWAVQPTESSISTNGIVQIPISDMPLQNANPDPFEYQEQFSSGETSAMPAPVLPIAAPTVVEKQVTSTWPTAIYLTIGGIWLIGALIFAVRLLVSHLKLIRLRQKSLEASSSEYFLCSEIAGRINVPAPQVRRSPILASPCLTGLLKPAILLPTEIKASVPLEKAFAHELAHLRRNDVFWNLLQRIALALFFYQPLLWRLVYRSEVTAEEVCDDYVVRHCLDPTGYAVQLVELAESNLVSRSLVGLGMFSTRSMLGHRVRRILDTTRSLKTHVSGPAITGIIVTTLACATLGGFLGNLKTSSSGIGESEPETAETKSEQTDGISVTGRVLDPNGKPLAGAKILVLPRVSYGFGKWNPDAIHRSQSESDGTFSFEIDESKLVHSGGSALNGRDNLSVIASHPGLGLAWVTSEDLLNGPVELRLIEDKPIRGSLITPEGEPIPNAKISVVSLHRFANNDLTPAIQAASNGRSFNEVLRLADAFQNFWSHVAVHSDDNGNFELRGVGAGRLASVRISGSSIAQQNTFVMTTDMKTLSVPSLGYLVKDTRPIYGRTPTITCEATQPIHGTVVDQKTGAPLAGVHVFSDVFAGTNVGGIRTLETITDELGKFELVGMPKGPGNRITLAPGDDQPYFMLEAAVPAGDGNLPVELRIELERGVWIRGKAVDKKTGEPIPNARLCYLPFLSNEIAADSKSITDGLPIQNRYETKSDGSFKLVGLPGGGVVGIHAIDQSYPVGLGWETVDDSEKNLDTGYVQTHHYPMTPSKLWPTAMQQVQIASDAVGVEVNFELDPGIAIPLEFVDESGQPLSGVRAKKLKSMHDWESTIDGTTGLALSFMPGETRLLTFRHDDRKLGAVAKLTAADSKPEEEGPDKAPSQTIKLLPMSTIKGRLVDSDGDPVIGAHLRFSVDGGGPYSSSLHGLTITDENGEFLHESVLPGTHYSILGEGTEMVFVVSQRLDVGPGELIDFGTIDVSNNDERPEPKRSQREDTKKNDAGQDQSEPEQAEVPLRQKGDQYVFEGSVIDEQLNRVGGATVRLDVRPRVWDPNSQVRTIAKATSGNDGVFLLQVNKSQLEGLDLSRNGNARGVIVAHKNQFGYAQELWQDLPDEGRLSFQLLAENVVRGRVIDLEGHAVANAAVIATSFVVARHDIELTDRWLDALKTGTPWPDARPKLGEGRKWEWAYSRFNSFNHRAVTDDNGEFEIRGVPRDAQLDIRIEHPQFVTQLEALVNRRIEPIEYKTHERAKNKLKLHGNRPLIVVQPSRPIVGTVRDAETGQPIAGARIFCTKMGVKHTVYGSSALPQTFSDENGRFELLGLPKSNETRLMVQPPADQPYIAQGISSLPDTVGMRPATIEMKLHRGIWISGRVTDQKTGVGVPAEIVYLPLLDNPHLKALDVRQTGWATGYENYFGHYNTQPDGTFRVVGLPGRAVLAADSRGGDRFRRGVGYKELLETAGRHYSKEKIEWFASIGEDVSQTKFIETVKRSVVLQYNVNTMTLIDPPTGDKEFSYDLQLDPGKTLVFDVVDPEGQLVEEVTVSHFDGRFGKKTFADGRIQLTKMGDDEERYVSLFNKDRSLAAHTKVSGDRKQNVDNQIQLQPTGMIRGRLVDDKGSPITGATVDTSFAEEVLTNANGTFVIRNLVAPYTYELRVSTADMEMGGAKYLQTKRELKPGQTVDLGDINLDAIKDVIISGLAGG